MRNLIERENIMAEKKDTEPDDKEQSQRFIDTARLLEVEESGEKFEKVVSIISEKEVAQNHK